MAACHSASCIPFGTVADAAIRVRLPVGAAMFAKNGEPGACNHLPSHANDASTPTSLGARSGRSRSASRRTLAASMPSSSTPGFSPGALARPGCRACSPRRHKRSSPRPSRSPTARSRTLACAPYLVSPATQDHGHGAGREVGTRPGTIGRRRPGCTLTVRTETDRYQALDAVPPSRSRRPKRTATKPPMPQARARPGDAFVLPDTAPHQPPLKQGWRVVWSSEQPDYGGHGTVEPFSIDRLAIPAHCAVLCAPDPAASLRVEPPPASGEKVPLHL